jgi:Na+-transporting NADH:ubiquinone oxidoreductase subunit C
MMRAERQQIPIAVSPFRRRWTWRASSAGPITLLCCGYQSTLYGFLALTEDTNTVLALKFYEQNDTPGIGGRIQDPDWEALWPGKRVFDKAGVLRIGVARGKVARSSANADYQVDGISGATRTSLGVNGLVRFWLGDLGFGRFLKRVRRGEG